MRTMAYKKSIFADNDYNQKIFINILANENYQSKLKAIMI